MINHRERDALWEIATTRTYDPVLKMCLWCKAAKAGFHHKNCPRYIAFHAVQPGKIPSELIPERDENTFTIPVFTDPKIEEMEKRLTALEMAVRIAECKPVSSVDDALVIADAAYADFKKRGTTCALTPHIGANALGVLAQEVRTLKEGRWHPISTAPVDGTHVILFPVQGSIGTGFFRSGEWYREVGGIYKAYPVSQPTHWMPLPSISGAK